MKKQITSIFYSDNPIYEMESYIEEKVCKAVSTTIAFIMGALLFGVIVYYLTK